MSKYDLNYKRLTLLVLPTFLRRPVMAALLYAAVAPLNELHMRFQHFRREADERMNRNGQVCRLRAVLNDTFDAERRRITVTDTTEGSDTLLVHLRSEERVLPLPRRRTKSAVRAERRGFGGIGGYDFAVNLPVALQGVDETRLRAVVETYKLASKRFAISYY